MISRMRVAKVEFKNAPVQFCVQAVVRPAMEDNFEVITHPALFRDEAKAERFAAKVLTAARSTWPNVGVDLSLWILPTSEASYIRNKINPGHYSVI